MSTITTVPADLDARLVLNPSVSVIRCNDDEVVASLGSRARSTHRIQDAQGRHKLADFVLAFAAPTEPVSVAATLGLDTDTATEFTRHLLDGQVLIAEEASHYSWLLSGFGLPAVNTDVAVAVVGSGRIAQSVCRQLGSLLGTELVPGDAVGAAFDDGDPLDDPGRHHQLAVGIDHLVLDRTRTTVQQQDARGHGWLLGRGGKGSVPFSARWVGDGRVRPAPGWR